MYRFNFTFLHVHEIVWIIEKKILLFTCIACIRLKEYVNDPIIFLLMGINYKYFSDVKDCES